MDSESTPCEPEHKSVQEPEADPEKQSIHDSEAANDVHDPPPVTAEELQPPPKETFPGIPVTAQYGGDLSPTFGTIGTGWSAMARIVREVDVQKIQDYKEDIDTILVFAGLFSAAMTAFLVESYHNLSQDPTQIMIFLLQQLTVQTHSYNFNGAFLNSTSPPLPAIPEFKPTSNAIRINVLWFSSLTLSLVSASFSILVKQWLREYLAGEYTSPQARLRIRHFRNPGLEHWKVFEIAALLPLLLQLSLALFLIGLCFFTADVHESIGHTTLPLVAGWGFLFIAASFAPALSPRCPYRTTLLKAAMRSVRKLIFKVIIRAKHISQRTTEAFTHIPTQWSYQMLNYDEEEAVATDTNDVDILIGVDSIQSDEQLLGIMWDAIQQTQLDPADCVTFILKVINHRLQSDVTTTPSDTFLDLKRLPKQTTTSIMSMTAEILNKEITRQSPTNLSKVIEWTPWMKDCVYILLSETSSPPPIAVNRMWSLLLSESLRYTTLFDIIKTRVPDQDTFSHVLDRLRGGLILVKGDYMLNTLTVFMQKYFCDESDPSHTHEKLVDFIRCHPDIPSDHLRNLVDLIIFCLTNETRPEEMFWFTYLVDELEIILELSSKASWRDTVIKLIQTILMQPKNAPIFYRFPLSLNDPSTPSLRKDAQDLFIDAVVASTPAERRTILANYRSSVSWQWRSHLEQEDNSWDRYIRLDPLESCEVMLRVWKAMEEKDIPTAEHSQVLGYFWWDVDEGLSTVAGRHYENHPDLARRCLELINELDVSSPPNCEDGDEAAFARWADGYPIDTTYFPDYSIERIAQFLPPEETTFNYRIRRLRLIKEREANQQVDAPEAGAPENIASSASRRSSRSSASRRRRSRAKSSTPPHTSASPERNAACQISDTDIKGTSSNKDIYDSQPEHRDSSSSGVSGNDHGKSDYTEDGVTVTLNVVPDGEDGLVNDNNDVLQPSPTDTAEPDHEIMYHPSRTPSISYPK